jgi:hypothetical protein
MVIWNIFWITKPISSKRSCISWVHWRSILTLHGYFERIRGGHIFLSRPKLGQFSNEFFLIFQNIEGAAGGFSQNILVPIIPIYSTVNFYLKIWAWSENYSQKTIFTLILKAPRWGPVPVQGSIFGGRFLWQKFMVI